MRRSLPRASRTAVTIARIAFGLPIAAVSAPLAVAQDPGPIVGPIIAQQTPPEIRMDGFFNDWLRVPPAAIDPADDASGDMDLRAVWVANRHTNLLAIALEFSQAVNLFTDTPSDETLNMLVSLPDGQLLTLDLRHGGCWISSGTTTGATRTRQSWAEIDLRAMPAHASRRFEMFLNLERYGIELGDIIEIRFTGADSLEQPIRFRYAPNETALTRRPIGPQSIDRSPRAEFRIASYNTFNGGLLAPTEPERRDRIARVVKAAAADIYCFQDEDTDSADTIRRRIEGIDPLSNAGSWNAVLTEGSAIVTHLPLVPLPPVAGVSVAAAVVLMGADADRPVVVYSAHLPAGGDRASQADAQRTRAAERIAAHIGELRAGRLGERYAAYAGAPVILAGTLNIVGSELPRVALEQSAGLRFAELPHMLTDGLDTWQDDGSLLPPQVRDHLVFAPGIEIASGFVVNVRRLGPVIARENRMHRADFEATPHMMLIADCLIPDASDAEPE